jgi:GTP-binding protein
MTSKPDADLIEQGRKLFAGDWHFAFAAPTIDALPPMEAIEVAFAGRSNVGKSSLINALTGRGNLARTSHTPGRTQEPIFFAASKAKVAAWTVLIHKFLQGRASLARVFVLVDARHGLKDVDIEVLNALDRSAVSYQLVLTKADQVKPAELSACLANTAAVLARHPAAYPEVLATSSRSTAGIAELRAAMARLLEQQKA